MENKEKQARFRAKMASEGRFEVRGIFAHKDDHLMIKAYAEKLLKRRVKGGRK